MPNNKSGKWYWITSASLFLVMMCNCGVGYYSISLFVKPVSQHFGITTGDYAIVYTFYGVGSAIAAAFLKKGLQWFSLKKMILFGGLISTLGYFLYTVAPALPVVYLGGALVGASTIFAGTATVQLAIAGWFSEKRSMVTGIVAAASGIGSAIGSPIIGGLIRNMGWKFAYIVIAVLIFVTVVVQCIFLFHNSPGEMGLKPYGLHGKSEIDDKYTEKEEGEPLSKVKATPRFAAFFLGMVAVAIVYQVISLYQSSILIEKGFSEELAATCLSVFAVVDMCSKASAGIISERFGFRTVTTYCSASVCTAFFLVRFIHTTPGALLFAALLGFWPTMIVLYGVTASISLFGKKYLSDYISVTQVLMCCVSLVGMPLVRKLYNAVGSFDTLMNIMMAVVAVFLVLMFILLKPSNLFGHRQEKR